MNGLGLRPCELSAQGPVRPQYIEVQPTLISTDLLTISEI